MPKFSALKAQSHSFVLLAWSIGRDSVLRLDHRRFDTSRFELWLNLKAVKKCKYTRAGMANSVIEGLTNRGDRQGRHSPAAEFSLGNIPGGFCAFFWYIFDG